MPKISEHDRLRARGYVETNVGGARYLVGHPYPDKPGVVERVLIAGSPPMRMAATIFPKRPIEAAQPDEAMASSAPRNTQPQVTITRAARSRVSSIVNWSTTCHGLEAGGVLLGRIRGGRAEIVDARRAESDPTPGSVDIDLGARHGILGLHVLGEFHAHPSGDGEPSAADRRGWELAYRHVAGPKGAPAWLSIIARAPLRRDPTLHYFLTDADGTKGPLALN